MLLGESNNSLPQVGQAIPFPPVSLICVAILLCSSNDMSFLVISVLRFMIILAEWGVLCQSVFPSDGLYLMLNTSPPTLLIG